MNWARTIAVITLISSAGCQALPTGLQFEWDEPKPVAVESDSSPKVDAQSLGSETQATVAPSRIGEGRRAAAHVSDGEESAVKQVAFTQPQETRQIPTETLPPATLVPESAPTDEALTLEKLENLALTQNPTLAEAQARIDAARGKWLQVGLFPNPVVGYSGQQLGSGGAAEQNGLFVGQQWIRGSKLQLNRAVAEQEIAIAQQHWEAQKRRVLTDVRLGYYEVLVAERRVTLSEQLVQIAEQAIKVAEALLRAEEVSQADVLRARIELQSNQLLLKTAENQHAAAWSRLVAVLGSTDMPLRPLSGELVPSTIELTTVEVLQRLFAESPELQAVSLGVERGRWAVTQAHAQGIPDVDFQGVIQYDNSTEGSNAIVQVTLPIPWFNWNQGGVREAQAELAAAELAVSRVELGLKKRLAGVFQRYATARNQVEDYSKKGGIIDNLGTTLEYVQKGYQAGQLAYMDLLGVQRTYAQTNLAYVEALGEQWAAIAEIEGLLLKDSLDATTPESWK